MTRSLVAALAALVSFVLLASPAAAQWRSPIQADADACADRKVRQAYAECIRQNGGNSAPCIAILGATQDGARAQTWGMWGMPGGYAQAEQGLAVNMSLVNQRLGDQNQLLGSLVSVVGNHDVRIVEAEQTLDRHEERLDAGDARDKTHEARIRDLAAQAAALRQVDQSTRRSLAAVDAKANATITALGNLGGVVAGVDAKTNATVSALGNLGGVVATKDELEAAKARLEALENKTK